MRCGLCQIRLEKIQFLCAECVATTQLFRSEGCQRCGVARCLGCDAMAGFEKVDCLFQLHKANANALVDAKDRQSSFAIAFFRQAFLKVFVQRILLRARVHNCDTILLSPLRLSRFLSGGWHLLLDVYEGLVGASDVVFPITFSAKNALVPSILRSKLQTRASPLFAGSLHQMRAAKSILFVDDVLTTGETAAKTRQFYEHHGVGAIWHFVSLFRTPQKAEPGEKMTSTK